MSSDPLIASTSCITLPNLPETIFNYYCFYFDVFILTQAWEDLMAPADVTYEDIVGIKAPKAQIHSRPQQLSREDLPESSPEPENQFEHLSTWIPVSQSGQVITSCPCKT